MSSTTNTVHPINAVEQKVADIGGQTAAMTTEYATKADVQRLERELAEVKLLIQQLLEAVASGRLPQHDLGQNIPARETPERNIQNPAAAADTIPVLSAPQTQAGVTSEGIEVDRPTAPPMPEVAVPTTSVPVQEVVDNPHVASDAAAAAAQHKTSVPLQSLDPNKVDVSTATPPVKEDPAATPSPLQDAFPILQAAVQAADANVLVAHVEFPQPHLPLPLGNEVEPNRIQDLKSAQNVLSGTMLQHKIELNRCATRSLSCAVEHYIASSAKTDPVAKIEQFNEELRSKLGLGATADPIQALKLIADDWASKTERVQQELRATRPQIVEDKMDAEDTTTDQTAPTIPLPQQQPVPQPGMGQQQNNPITHAVPSGHAPSAPATAAPHSANKPDEEMLTTEEFEKLQPIASPHEHIFSVPDDIRFAAVTKFCRTLKTMNPHPSDRAPCRLSGNEVYEMAQQMELRIIMRIHQGLSQRRLSSAPAAILEEYRSREATKVEEYRHSVGFRQGVRKFHTLAKEMLNRARTSVHGFWNRASRGGSNRPVAPAPPAIPPPVVRPPVVQAISIDIDMEDAQTNGKADCFLPGKATFFSTTNQSTTGNNQGSNTSRPADANMGANQNAVPSASSVAAPIPPNQGASSANPQAGQGDNSQSNLGPTQASTMPPTNQDTSQVPPPSAAAQNTGVPTSDLLAPTDLAWLQQPSTQTPSALTISTELRSEVIVDFYDTFVDANTKIPRLNQGQEIQLLQDCVLAGTAPFWNDFVPLSAEQLANMAKKFEDLVFQDLQKKVGDKKMYQAKQVMEYRKLASKLGISPNAAGIERFASEAKNVRDREQP